MRWEWKVERLQPSASRAIHVVYQDDLWEINCEGPHSIMRVPWYPPSHGLGTSASQGSAR